MNPIFKDATYIICENYYEFKECNDYLNSIGIFYYKEGTHDAEKEKDYNSYIYLHNPGIDDKLRVIHYELETEQLDSSDIQYKWSVIKAIVGYKSYNIIDTLDNLDKLANKLK